MDGKTRLGLGVLGGAGARAAGRLVAASDAGGSTSSCGSELVGAGGRDPTRASADHGEGRWLVPVAMLFALCVAWRDSAALAALNLLAFVVASSPCCGPGPAAAARRRLGVRAGRPLRRSAELCRTGTRGGARGRMASGGARVWRLRPRRGARRSARCPPAPSSRPFAAADAVFQTLLSDFFGFDVAEALGHLFLTLVLAWIAAGALWVSLLAQGRDNLSVRRPDVYSLGIGEVGTVLGLLDLLFVAFVAVQIRYLFGGADRVVSTAGLTYAEYARRGFFELVTRRR